MLLVASSQRQQKYALSVDVTRARMRNKKANFHPENKQK